LTVGCERIMVFYKRKCLVVRRPKNQILELIGPFQFSEELIRCNQWFPSRTWAANNLSNSILKHLKLLLMRLKRSF